MQPFSGPEQKANLNRARGPGASNKDKGDCEYANQHQDQIVAPEEVRRQQQERNDRRDQVESEHGVSGAELIDA